MPRKLPTRTRQLQVMKRVANKISKFGDGMEEFHTRDVNLLLNMAEEFYKSQQSCAWRT